MKPNKYTFISDIHLGSMDCQIDSFKDIISNKKNKNIVICGDLFDCGYKGDMRFSQSMTVDDAIEEAVHILKGTNRIFGIITGNHDWRVTRETGLNPCKIVCDRLKMPYMGEWYENEDFFVTHGIGSAQTVKGEFDRWLKFSTAKYIVKGHSHKLYFHPFPSFSDVRVGIVAGCTKVEGTFEHRYGLTCVQGYARLDTSKPWYQSVELVGL